MGSQVPVPVLPPKAKEKPPKKGKNLILFILKSLTTRQKPACGGIALTAVVPGYSGTSAGSRSHSVTALWFAASPLLLSVSIGPSHTPSVGRLAGSRRVVEGVMTLDGGFYVAVRDVRTGASAVVMQCGQGVVHHFVDNASWAVMTMYILGEGNSTSLAVASLRGLPGGGRGGGDTDALGRAAVVVEIPFVSVLGSSLLRMYPDESVDGEVVVVHSGRNAGAWLC
ncbi:hypothetical protein Pelo_19442 [Pelomyxa schiedti]|nr:hypothetical protein Pelo_19442 [Pelomyxa schiedti]